MNLIRRRVGAAAATFVVVLAAGCAGGGTDSPATINSSSADGNGVTITVPSRGTATGGQITVSAASYLPLADGNLQITMRIANTAAAPDTLVGATSNIGKKIVVTPASVAIPAAGLVSLSTRPPTMVVTPYEKLAPRETIEITLDLRNAGPVQVYLGEAVASS
jgi:copper(I)-binding protein